MGALVACWDLLLTGWTPQPRYISIYFIDTDKIPGFLLLLKIISSSRAVNILFLSLTCEDIGVAMVTNIISQLQESFPLRRAAGSFEISFTKWLRGAMTVQLRVTFSMSCQISTWILFPCLKNIQEDLPKSRKVMLKNSLRGKKMHQKKGLFRLKISQKVSARRAPRKQRNREDSSEWISYVIIKKW